jgi:hypothetical protein
MVQGITTNLWLVIKACSDRFQCNSISETVKFPTILYDFIDKAQYVRWFGQDPSTGKRVELTFGSGSGGNIGSVEYSTNRLLQDGSYADKILLIIPPWLGYSQVVSDINDPSYDLHNLQLGLAIN